MLQSKNSGLGLSLPFRPFRSHSLSVFGSGCHRDTPADSTGKTIRKSYTAYRLHVPALDAAVTGSVDTPRPTHSLEASNVIAPLISRAWPYGAASQTQTNATGAFTQAHFLALRLLKHATFENLIYLSIKNHGGALAIKMGV